MQFPRIFGFIVEANSSLRYLGGWGFLQIPPAYWIPLQVWAAQSVEDMGWGPWSLRILLVKISRCRSEFFSFEVHLYSSLTWIHRKNSVNNKKPNLHLNPSSSQHLKLSLFPPRHLRLIFLCAASVLCRWGAHGVCLNVREIKNNIAYCK